MTTKEELRVRTNLHVKEYTYKGCESDFYDTVGDCREYSSGGVTYFQRCTVANATKGSGTWVTTTPSGTPTDLTDLTNSSTVETTPNDAWYVQFFTGTLWKVITWANIVAALKALFVVNKTIDTLPPVATYKNGDTWTESDTGIKYTLYDDGVRKQWVEFGPVSTNANSAYSAKTSNYTLTASDYQIECTANSFTLSLPTAVGIAGKIYSIKNTGTGTITLDAYTTETIDEELTQTIEQWDNILIMSNNVNWIII